MNSTDASFHGSEVTKQVSTLVVLVGFLFQSIMCGWQSAALNHEETTVKSF